MHKRDDAERALRALAINWAEETDYRYRPGYYPSFGAFVTWLGDKHYSHYLDFRSTAGARYEAEGWFESEINNHRRRLATEQTE